MRIEKQKSKKSSGAKSSQVMCTDQCYDRLGAIWNYLQAVLKLEHDYGFARVALHPYG